MKIALIVFVIIFVMAFFVYQKVKNENRWKD